MRSLAVGIIGAGKMARAHIRAIRSLDCARVVALASRDRAKGTALCAEYEIPHWYDDYRTMLSEEQLDVVHDCAPNMLHFQINRDSILSGRHVLSEKPLTCSARESGELVELARQQGVHTAVNFVYRHYPVPGQIRELVRNGALGEVWAIHGTYLQDWLADDQVYDWRVEASHAGPSRAIADIGSHWIDMAMFVLGQEIVEVCADMATFIPVRPGSSVQGAHAVSAHGGRADHGSAQTVPEAPENVQVDTEDYASMLLRFEHGARGCLTLSQVCHGRRSGLSFTVEGSKGSVAWRYEEQERLDIRMRNNEALGRARSPDDQYATGSQTVATSASQYAQSAMIGSFYGSILGGQASSQYADFEQGWRVDSVIEAAVESARRGGWVWLENLRLGKQ